MLVAPRPQMGVLLSRSLCLQRRVRSLLRSPTHSVLPLYLCLQTGSQALKLRN